MVTLTAFNARIAPRVTGLVEGWPARARRAVWNAFEASGRARAEREMLDFAAGCEISQPTLAAELRSAIRQARSR